MNSSIPVDTYNENRTTANISAVPFLPTRFIHYISWLILMSIVGTVGNMLIICSSIINQKLRVLSNVFVVNLAFADIFVTSIVDPLAVIAVFNEGEFFYRHEGLCTFAGAFIVICCGSSIWTIATISFERYIHICHPLIYPYFFNRRTVPVILVCLWIIAFCIVLPYFDEFGWGTFGYYTKGRICTCIFNVNYFYSWYHIGLGIVLPMIIIPFCYIKIYLLVRKSSRRLSKHSHIINNSKWQDSDMRILKMVVTIWAVFMTMWSPYIINILFDTTSSWPDFFFMTAALFCLSNSSINFIIYGIMNENFREAYVMIFCKIFVCFKGLFLSRTSEVENNVLDLRLRVHMLTESPSKSRDNFVISNI